VKTPCIDLHIPMLIAKGLRSIQRIKNECSRSDNSLREGLKYQKL